MVNRQSLVVLCSVLLSAAAGAPALPSQRPMPPRLDAFLTNVVKLTAAERRQLVDE